MARIDRGRAVGHRHSLWGEYFLIEYIYVYIRICEGREQQEKGRETMFGSGFGDFTSSYTL